MRANVSVWHTTLKPPVNHSQVSVRLILPPGPSGPGFISASSVHVPTNTDSFLCSGLGCGAPAGCWASTTILPTRVKATTRATLPRFNMCASFLQSAGGPRTVQTYREARESDNDRVSQIPPRGVLEPIYLRIQELGAAPSLQLFHNF